MAEVHVATLVVPVALSRVDALAVIALAVEGQVVGAFTPDAHVPLPDGARAYVEIPRFGDPPPFAIDVESEGGAGASRLAAEDLARRLRASTGWEIHQDF
ncbi:MAG: hypothetical protein HY996_04770 [Micrococcales bacterium]|nr:hypothetical protein [Micrococcales bacterium]